MLGAVQVFALKVCHLGTSSVLGKPEWYQCIPRLIPPLNTNWSVPVWEVRLHLFIQQTFAGPGIMMANKAYSPNPYRPHEVTSLHLNNINQTVSLKKNLKNLFSLIVMVENLRRKA